ncbi:MAG TPA: malto-oligosyltrehalose synthase [Stellaceae bacterium]|nr:malto-oligosyltrehalose synthase [Stellaceae bacterium]
MIPRATYRLQLNKDFTFADAARLVPYLAKLGISQVYASPILAARPGSPHGYDVIDPARVNPELGGEDGLRALVGTLRQAGLGLIVDFVPNHMYAGNGNLWWEDVLRHGRASAFATFFDIDWNSANPLLKNKILLPILGKPYGEALASGEMILTAADDGGFVIRYFDRTLPIAPECFAAIAATSPGAFDRQRLHALLERQHYRLAWWRAAADEINWRRFFDITDLAGIRVEQPEVFEAVHATLLRLYAEGVIDGVRLDHVDGLADPGAYCRKLRGQLDQLAKARPESVPAGPAYLIVEKILGRGERLPAGWRTDGTVGYDFMNEISGLLHDPAGEEPLTALWHRISGRTGSFAAEETAARREILDRSFAAQWETVVTALTEIAQGDLDTRDIGRAAIRRCLAALLARFHLYRTYPGPEENNEQFLAPALDAAKRHGLAGDRGTLGRLGHWLRHDFHGAAGERARTLFQQLTAPLAAKAVEDTAFYRYGRLLSRNDVGFDAACFAYTRAQFHAAMKERLTRFPHALLATATHDHKRGEDIRARLAVISEIPAEWARTVESCLTANAGLRETVDGAPAPSPGDEYILYQTIVGAWPPELTLADRSGCEAFATRLAAWQQKAAREAKLATDWTVPNLAYEQAARRFLTRLFAEPGEGLQALAHFARRIGPAGAVNGLAQLLLKLTAPGIPDLYQGTEFWDLSLTDPDNRRPVDYASRRSALDAAPPAAQCADTWRDGRLKQAVIARVLAARRDLPELFADGDYLPLTVTGPAADHVVAFARRRGTETAIAIVMRFATRLMERGDRIAVAAERWRQTSLSLPGEIAGEDFDDILGDGALRATSAMPVDLLLRGLPIGLWVCRPRPIR